MRFSVGHSGNIDGQNVLRVQTRLCPLQCDQRSDQHTCAGQQDERRGDLRYREISECLAIPLGSVMGNLSRARQKMRDAILRARKQSWL